MEKEDIEALAVAIAKILDDKHGEMYCPLNPQRRREDHEWILKRRRHEEAKTAMYNALSLHLAKWGMVGVLSAVFYALWLAFKIQVMRG
jgi:hypothetical protein